MIWILAAIYILILFIELPTLIKNRWYREIAVFGIIFIIGVYLGGVQFYHWPFYNPIDTLLPMIGNS